MYGHEVLIKFHIIAMRISVQYQAVLRSNKQQSPMLIPASFPLFKII